jgi:ribosome-associated protein
MATKTRSKAAKRGTPARAKPRTNPKGKRTAPRGGPPARRAKAPGARGPRRPATTKAAALAPPSSAAPAAARPDDARPTALAAAHAGLDKKAEDVTVLDVRGLASYADYFVVMTADSDRQASAIADHVDETLKKSGVSKVGVEGYGSGSWILVDYGDVVAHVMSRDSRAHYDLEGLWADAPRFRVEG